MQPLYMSTLLAAHVFTDTAMKIPQHFDRPSHDASKGSLETDLVKLSAGKVEQKSAQAPGALPDDDDDDEEELNDAHIAAQAYLRVFMTSTDKPTAPIPSKPFAGDSAHALPSSSGHLIAPQASSITAFEVPVLSPMETVLREVFDSTKDAFLSPLERALKGAMDASRAFDAKQEASNLTKKGLGSSVNVTSEQAPTTTVDHRNSAPTHPDVSNMTKEGLRSSVNMTLEQPPTATTDHLNKAAIDPDVSNLTKEGLWSSVNMTLEQPPTTTADHPYRLSSIEHGIEDKLEKYLDSMDDMYMSPFERQVDNVLHQVVPPTSANIEAPAETYWEQFVRNYMHAARQNDLADLGFHRN